ncbi:MAG: prepilin-type N-terminal cleavage/methylation domain-containing protein, partial [Desulfobacteraceae bacterium]
MSEKSRETEKTNGFTLIEVLIAIFILTVGILAVAAMQIASIQ